MVMKSVECIGCSQPNASPQQIPKIGVKCLSLGPVKRTDAKLVDKIKNIVHAFALTSASNRKATTSPSLLPGAPIISTDKNTIPISLAFICKKWLMYVVAIVMSAAVADSELVIASMSHFNDGKSCRIIRELDCILWNPHFSKVLPSGSLTQGRSISKKKFPGYSKEYRGRDKGNGLRYSCRADIVRM